MYRLYMRIFLSFWLTVTLAGAIMAIIAYMNRPPERMFPPEGDHNFADRALASYAQDARMALARGGLDGWRHYVTTRRDRNAELFIVGQDGKPLLQRPVDPEIVPLVQQVFAEQRIKIKHHDRDIYFAQPFKDHLQRPAVLVVHLHMPPPPDKMPFFRAGPLIFLAVFLLIGGLVCWWLARSLTSPIQTLRNVTQQFAGGDLSVRVGDSITGQSEIKDLANDFDTMAQRIEQQVESQQRLQRDISHELRSPLARLNVALELARQRSGDQAESALNRIERESDRLNEMIGQLLSLHRLESEVLTCEHSLDLSALLVDLVADANFEAHARNVVVRVKNEPGVSIRGDEKLLYGAIENVLRNAVRYTKEDSSVEVAMRKLADKVLITVRDHGPGIDDAALEKIFQPFYRVDDSRERNTGGTGIGLAIADRTIRRHGGTIRARNVVGGGLEVVIELPNA
nr:ATP-binding protein [uncultured Desulfuromonas sp.]